MILIRVIDGGCIELCFFLVNQRVIAFLFRLRLRLRSVLCAGSLFSHAFGKKAITLAYCDLTVSLSVGVPTEYMRLDHQIDLLFRVLKRETLIGEDSSARCSGKVCHICYLGGLLAIWQLSLAEWHL